MPRRASCTSLTLPLGRRVIAPPLFATCVLLPLGAIPPVAVWDPPPVVGPCVVAPPVVGPCVLAPPVVGPCVAAPPVVVPCVVAPPVVGPCVVAPVPPVAGPCVVAPPVVGPCVAAPPPVVGPCDAPPPDVFAAGLGAGAEGFLSVAAMAMLLMPRNAATTAAAEKLLKALKRTGIVIESSFPFRSHGPALHSRSADLLCKWTEQCKRVTQRY
jgi:hypothetical protein